MKLQREKAQLEQTLEKEQEQQISKLTGKIKLLEKETIGKQLSLEKVSGKDLVLGGLGWVGAWNMGPAVLKPTISLL